MAEKKQLTEKEIESKLKELKVELLKQSSKRKDIKREIAKLLTVAKLIKPSSKTGRNQTK